MLYTLAKALHQDDRIRLSVVILNHGTLEEKLRQQRIDVYVVDETRLHSLRILKRLNRIIDEIRPDVIHTHRIKENILGALAAWKNGRIPSLQTLHGAQEHAAAFYQLHRHLKYFVDWLNSRYYQRYIVAVSPALQQALQRRFPADKVRLIENGIDIDGLVPHGYQAHAGRELPFRVGIAGRLMPVKRVDLFIQCAVQFHRQHPDIDVQFHIYGDGPLREALQRQVDQAGAGHYIHFEGHCENMPAALQRLDLLMMTSDHEGLPMILLEAMSCATAVLCHAVGGIPHLLDHGQYGFLVREHHAQAYADALHHALHSDLDTLTQRAFQRVRSQYSATRMATDYIDLYRQAAGDQAFFSANER